MGLFSRPLVLPGLPWINLFVPVKNHQMGKT